MSVTPHETPAILEFTQVFDGAQPELSAAEKLEAATLFKSGVQEVFLQHIDSVKRLDGAVALYPYDYSELGLDTVLEDGSRLSFGARSFDTETEDPYTLDISENQSFDAPYRHVRYSLDATGGEVRRFDMNHTPLSAETKKALGKLMSGSTFAQKGLVVNEDGAKRIDPEELEAAKEELTFTWNDEFERRETERQLGLNDQPVGPDEVRILLSLLEKAKPKHALGPNTLT